MLLVIRIDMRIPARDCFTHMHNVLLFEMDAATLASSPPPGDKKQQLLHPLGIQPALEHPCNEDGPPETPVQEKTWLLFFPMVLILNRSLSACLSGLSAFVDDRASLPFV